jgi:hypothetical protein
MCFGILIGLGTHAFHAIRYRGSCGRQDARARVGPSPSKTRPAGRRVES